MESLLPGRLPPTSSPLSKGIHFCDFFFFFYFFDGKSISVSNSTLFFIFFWLLEIVFGMAAAGRHT